LQRSRVGIIADSRDWARRGVVYAPAIFFAVYVAGTYLLFLFDSAAARVTNWPIVSLFISGVVVAFVAGFVGFSAVLRLRGWAPVSAPRDTLARDRIVILVASGWFIAYSILSMISYGVTDPIRLVLAILDPRHSYYGKFAAAGLGWALPFQVINLTGVFYFLLVPFAAFHWRRLRWWHRTAAIAGVSLYLLFYLSIGTQKGVADTAIALLTVLAAIVIARFDLASLIRRARWGIVAAAAVVVSMVVFVTYSLGSRVGNDSRFLAGEATQSLLRDMSAVVGPVFARGIVLIADYASEGYLGLSYSLRLPFEWTGGLGSAPAFSSYLPQYFGLPDPIARSYPDRVGAAFGWSPTLKWSTVYPWLASDVSFVGVVVLMVLLGAVCALAWRHFALGSSPLALSVLLVIAEFVFYSPANNQLFISRWSGWGTITIAVLYAVGVLRAQRPRRALRLLSRFAFDARQLR
jgi:hypothetical protein